ncbi:MAG: D-alanyl-lipoteichoic acid biosynthesis protein DltB [Verrucomicrobiaceae bacterium]|nr:D-alanyl-lipoteichoic acid biosynthesis protein DltB [Verrucomicrobiaceae bacterium]
MIFQSVDYLVFLVCVLAVYWSLPHRPQNVVLLIAGYVFYGYVHPWYGILLGATTLVDFLCSRQIEDRPAGKKFWLGCILLSNFTVLATFKYFGFFTENVVTILRAMGLQATAPVFHMLLPAGVSFYTFQSCAYAVDVYRGETRARRNLLDYAVYVAFFPQLVAGPIERADHLLTQVERPRKFSAVVMQDALFLFLWGLMKKRVIADTAALYCNKAFSLSDSSFPIVWAGVLCFCVQIYADFSAYTDMARGSAKMLGFDLRQNFNHPWLAQSPADFWRRWHMSLSSWFRDYVFIPLGGSRCSEGKIARNLMITFLLSGLWHGASWNFILWGGWWGVWLVVWRQFELRAPGLAKGGGTARSLMRWALTFVLMNIGWLLFREQNLHELVRQMTASPFNAPAKDWRIGGFFTALMAIYSLPLWLHAVLEKPLLSRWGSLRNSWQGFALQTAGGIVLFLGLLLMSSKVSSDFIYFQF